jgi:putative endonuclease
MFWRKWAAWRCRHHTTAGEIGATGERRAERFLQTREKYRVLARNWRSPQDRRDELDLVCLDGDIVVFVEVKTRSPAALVSGFQAIDRRKKRVLLRTAKAYLRSLVPMDRPATFRFDVVEVASIAEPSDADIFHFKNVPLFEKDFWA